MVDRVEDQDMSAFFQYGREGWHGILTYNVLLDKLGALDIRHAPDKCTMRFTWYATITSKEVPTWDFQNNMLFLCHNEVALDLLKRYPSCFCVIPVDDDEDLSWIEESRMRARVLAFKSEHRFYYYDNILQSIFVNHLLWHREMDRIVYMNGTLDDLIDASERVLNNFVCVTDTGFNLIAYSRATEPRCLEHPYLIENKCLSKEATEYLRSYILPLSSRARKVIVSEAHAGRSFTMLHYPLYIEGQYLFHIAMECVNGSDEACRDLFEEFMKRVITICTAFWHSTVNLESPWHRVLTALISGENVTKSYLNLQIAQTNIPDAKQFRLLVAPFIPSMGNQRRNEILTAASRMNGGSSYPFMYEDKMLILLYSKKEGEDALASKVVDDTVTEVLTNPFGMHASCSQLFTCIEDISFAYRQATIAWRYRKPLTKEWLLSGQQEEVAVYPFEHVLKFYLLAGDCDRDLVDYSFKYSVLRRLVNEDAEAATEIAHLLWIYLSCDRNATETAKRVHVHRNTVLYHVGRIEKRFGLDFSSPMLKDRMILDYTQIISEDAF